MKVVTKMRTSYSYFLKEQWRHTNLKMNLYDEVTVINKKLTGNKFIYTYSPCK